MVPDDRASLPQTEAQLEALDRLAAVRTVTDALVVGHWHLDPLVIEGLTRILVAARRWAERAAA